MIFLHNSRFKKQSKKFSKLNIKIYNKDLLITITSRKSGRPYLLSEFIHWYCYKSSAEMSQYKWPEFTHWLRFTHGLNSRIPLNGLNSRVPYYFGVWRVWDKSPVLSFSKAISAALIAFLSGAIIVKNCHFIGGLWRDLGKIFSIELIPFNLLFLKASAPRRNYFKKVFFLERLRTHKNLARDQMGHDVRFFSKQRPTE